MAEQVEITDAEYHTAIERVRKLKYASVEVVQRGLKGSPTYVRAAKIMDRMEAEGLIGPYRGSKPREIFIEHAEDKKA